ncbi:MULTISPECIES: DNA polymerase III subunit delta' [Enterocloster]|uniref:DNA polymerase III subunit delta' n=1 Tax=Enterocloster TaxID=2719313 RepID=UPI000D19C261|nr:MULTISPECIES: DNA polymerase III subunit delta' [Enterocloster]MBS5602999.1 DNA polymerase III subunit delta' [Enterocloster asparagiformis]MCB6345284.1 DNA polymerase III subunit delta' [Enterocloster lavalensis]MDR3755657.1 DNA polymerase III subunit delta' [Enterocloster sp.]PST33145.1 DNA polymerase III subunit delta' [Enterocloster lavalensis]
MLELKEILGHEPIKEHFFNAVLTGNISHAYILSGEAGMGKKSLANAFALALLCEKGQADPCRQCHACKQVMSGNHPDLIYVTHEKPASIGVDDVRRQINDTIQVKPYSSAHKIYIVDEAEKMTVQAQNALLKTIEEPPAYAVILLLTTNAEAFLPTILSRCVQLKLKPLKDGEVKDYLVSRMGVELSQAEIYTAFARGNLGKAIHLADSEDFRHLYGELLDLLKNLKKSDISELLERIRKMKEDKLDIHQCLDFMQMWYRDVLMYKTTKDINLLIFKDEFSTVNAMSTVSGYEGLERILTAIDKARIRLDANVNMELVMELLLLTMKEN